MTRSDFDYLIVGQGLSGSLLAWLLMQNGQRVVVLDGCCGPSASRVAAGLVNPVTGQRWVKQPLVDAWLPAAHSLYDSLSRYFGEPFFQAKGFIRVFRSEADRAMAQKRKADPEYQTYLGGYGSAGTTGYALNDPLGSVRQEQCGYLSTVPLLDELERYFRQKGCRVDRPLQFEQFHPSRIPMDWHGLTFHRVVFCEGYWAHRNPWFGWLPFQPSAGDILTLQTDHSIPDDMVNKGHWLLPLNNGIFKFGATYRRAPFGRCVEPNGKRILLNSLADLFEPPITVTIRCHQTGIRPGTEDKQPFIGAHPRYSNLFIFNGFGSKGALMIPWYANRFMDHLLHEVALPSEADIQRYYRTYASVVG